MPKDRCPVCKARFRASQECSRCGADLKEVMDAIARAYAARRECRLALTQLDTGLALRWAAQAQRICSTPAGSKLLTLCRLLSVETRHGATFAGSAGFASAPSPAGLWK